MPPFPAATTPLPGIQYVSEVISGPEIVARIGTIEDLAALASNPMVEHVFVNHEVHVN